MRYLVLLGVALRRSITLGAQYRSDFVVGALMSIVWTALGIVPLWSAFRGRPPVGGWSFDEALVVVGWFTLLKGVLEGAVNPSLVQVVDHIRQGTLDFVLLKPADAQFLVSTAKLEPFRVVDVAAGIGIVVVALRLVGHVPAPGDVAIALLLLASAIAILYSLWILVVAAAFWVVRLDNLSYLLSSVLDFARWPRSVFHGVLAFVFTFVLPLALMTSFPAEALLGRLHARTAAASIAFALVFACLARRTWQRALGRYTSASS